MGKRRCTWQPLAAGEKLRLREISLSQTEFESRIFFRRLCALAALVAADPTAAALKDDQGCTVLHWACYNGNSNCVEFLLNHSVFDFLEGKLFFFV